MPNSIFRSQPLFIGQIFMCAGPAVLKRPHRRQGAAMAVGEAPNTQRHTGDRQQHQHNRRSNTTSSREKIKADAEQEPLSGDQQPDMHTNNVPIQEQGHYPNNGTPQQSKQRTNRAAFQ